MIIQIFYAVLYALIGILLIGGILFFVLLTRMRLLFYQTNHLQQILHQEEIKLQKLIQLHDQLLLKLTEYLNLTQQEIYYLTDQISTLPKPIMNKKSYFEY